ncbi:hypothetical protein ABZ863_13035 [Saccharomonospora sp. NPDC046836]|uniref:hypothetical protein n=1 Tax=Saccharomonospora sp. NPDC046836 TaxID=3156921 RepID=UPI0033EB0C4A
MLSLLWIFVIPLFVGLLFAVAAFVWLTDRRATQMSWSIGKSGATFHIERAESPARQVAAV